MKNTTSSVVKTGSRGRREKKERGVGRGSSGKKLGKHMRKTTKKGDVERQGNSQKGKEESPSNVSGMENQKEKGEDGEGTPG